MLTNYSHFLKNSYTIYRRCFCGHKLRNVQPSRSLMGFSDDDGSRTKTFSERKVLGYSKEQLFDVVANVDEYKYFVPWCRSSRVIERSDNHAKASLEVGFPPVSEKYTSVLTLVKPNLVKSECMDGMLFNHLICDWNISNGLPDVANSCTLNFYISFEFRSLFHSHLSSMFFDEVARKMISAFENRCTVLYGVSSIDQSKLDGHRHRRRKRPKIAKLPRKT